MLCGQHLCALVWVCGCVGLLLCNVVDVLLFVFCGVGVLCVGPVL